MSRFVAKAPPAGRGHGSAAPRRVTTGQRPPIHPVMAVGSRLGNSSLERWMAASGIQAKLHVTESNDKHEKEADSVAAKVMRAPSDKPVDEPISRVSGGPAQRMTGSPLLHHPEPLDETRQGSPLIQRSPEEKRPVQSKEEEPVQKAEEGAV